MSLSSAYYAKIFDNLRFHLCVIHTKLLNTGIMLNYINGKPFLIILLFFISNSVALKISIAFIANMLFQYGEWLLMYC